MKIQHGARPVRINHKDLDFLKSHRVGTTTVPQFADEFFADAGLTMPNQNAVDTEFTPPTPSMPEGCTDFGQADITTDLTKKVHNPNYLESVTHANANGGCEMQVSLDAAVTIGWFKQYFKIVASGALDYFDSFRLAQLMGVNVGENRSISLCTPWFPSWEQAAISGKSVMPSPTTAEIASIATMPWHNSKLDGWTSIAGVLVYRDKSWQGAGIGDKGFLYFPRDVINLVMGISGTAGFTPTNNPVLNPQTISLSTLQWIMSVARNLLQDIL